jgi:hypothetical protein
MKSQIQQLSVQKYSSNVIEKCLDKAPMVKRFVILKGRGDRVRERISYERQNENFDQESIWVLCG